MMTTKGGNFYARYQKIGQTYRSQKGYAQRNGNSPFENGRIETTVTRAKEVRAMTEKMITFGKENTLASRRHVLAYVTKEDVVKSFLTRLHLSMRTETAVTAV